MTNEKILQMRFSKLYPLLVAKALKKGRTADEVQEVVTWLTGHDASDIERMLSDETTYGAFFQAAPELNPNRKLIKGTICGVRVEDIEDPSMLLFIDRKNNTCYHHFKAYMIFYISENISFYFKSVKLYAFKIHF